MAFDKPVIFTSNDPSQALMNNVNIAFKVGGGDGKSVDEIKAVMAQAAAQGLNVTFSLWQVDATSEILDVAAATGINNVIVQSEGPSQLINASEVAKKAQAAGLSVAVVTNFDGIAPGQWGQYFGPNAVAMPEAYSNANPNATPANMLFRATQVGATNVVVVLGTYDATSEGGKIVPLAEYLAELKVLGITDFGAFSMESMSAADRDTLRNWLAGFPTAPVPPTPQPPPVATPPVVATPPPTPPTPTPTPHTQTAGPGIDVQKPLSVVDSPGYKGETDPTKTYAFTDKTGNDNTLTFRPNGIVVQTKADGSSFVVWDPANNGGQHWPGFATHGITDPNAGKDFSATAKSQDGRNPDTVDAAIAAGGGASGGTTPTGEPTPAWHANPHWQAPDASSKSALAQIAPSINANSVLEERAGANNNLLLRMADGTYKSIDLTTGAVTGAGTWNSNQWAGTGYAGGSASSGDTNSATGGGTPTSGPTVTTLSPDQQAQSRQLMGSTVLATAPGKDGNVLMKMEDGAIMSMHPDGTVVYAGYWKAGGGGLFGGSSSGATVTPILATGGGTQTVTESPTVVGPAIPTPAPGNTTNPDTNPLGAWVSGTGDKSHTML